MSKRLLSHDPITGLYTWHDYDWETDTTHISYSGEANSILDHNKALANDTDITKEGIKDGMWLYASIPAIVQMKWLTEDGIDVYNKDHGPRISQKLEDPAYRYLKTTTLHHRFK